LVYPIIFNFQNILKAVKLDLYETRNKFQLQETCYLIFYHLWISRLFLFKVYYTKKCKNKGKNQNSRKTAKQRENSRKAYKQK